jgi:SNF2 family DNA or RNA helicase
MGLGKTVSTLTALDHLDMIEPGPTLVLAPLRVATTTWPDEAAKWEHLRGMVVSPVVGSRDARVRALLADANVFTTNYETLPWLVEHFGARWPFRKIVADESTRLKSFRPRQGGLRAKALAKVAHRQCSRFIELTGTPSPNGLVDLWGQAWFLDKGDRLGASFAAFTNRWFRSVRVGQSAFAVRLDPLPHAQREIQERLADLCMTLDARDHFDIAEPIHNVIRVRLPEKARRLYRDMERDLFLQLESGQDVEAFSAAAKSMKCLQLANGAVYTDPVTESFEEIHDAKLQALDSILAEAAGAPVLVAYHFKSDLIRLQNAFPGGRKLDANHQTVRDWNAGKIPVLFCHPAAAGHGLNLQDGGNILVMFGHNWNLEEYQQIIERIGPTRQAQSGHPRPVFVHHIVAEDTIDEVVIERRESKREVQD